MTRPVTPVPGMHYEKRAGGPALGWSRRICTDNAAAVTYEIDKAVRRGDAVVPEDKGIIRIENASRLDPQFPRGGQRSPAWYVPMNNVTKEN